MRQRESGQSEIMFIALLLIVVAAVGLVGCPHYRVFNQRKTGEASYAEAESNRRIRTLEAEAQHQAAKSLAQAEIERARGVAEANRIIGQSLHNNPDYLKWLWIHNMEVASEHPGTTVVYVPMDPSQGIPLPVTEAGRLMNTNPVATTYIAPK
jgi:hypothetical protein